MIQTGTPAPDLRLKDQFGRDVALSPFRGRRNVMILFYPLDWTPT